MPQLYRLNGLSLHYMLGIGALALGASESGLCRLARCPFGLELARYAGLLLLSAGPGGLVCGPDMLDCRFAPLGLRAWGAGQIRRIVASLRWAWEPGVRA